MGFDATVGVPGGGAGSGDGGAAGDTDGGGVDGRDGPVAVEGCDGAFEAGAEVTGELTGGVAVRCATVRAGAPADGFGGADGASRKMTSDRPTNPIATAAVPYRASVFREGCVRPPERG